MFRKIFSFATLTLLVALALSSIAAWYSIQGLMAIFAAAVIPIMVMGGSLEIAKVVTTVWLHNYWDRANWKLKAYLVPSVIVLAFLTSMGIFGFLSKAHSDQTLVGSDTQAQIAVYDEKIKVAKEGIDENRKALAQLDAQVDQSLNRTTDDKGVNRSVTIRRQQATERAKLNKEITGYQEQIAKLTNEAIPIRAQIRKVEAEVGPIKYIAALIYGDNPDAALLERAVRWVIIVIVFVFDPLALTLVLAAQSSYKWLDDDLKKKKDYSPEPDILNHNLSTPEEYNEHSVPVPNVESKDPIQSFLGEEPFEVEVTKPIVSDEEVPSISENDNKELDDNLLVRKDSRSMKNVDTIANESEIETEGVTFNETGGGYVQYDGKSIHKSALEVMRPDLFIAKPDIVPSNSSYGVMFPKFATKGEMFVRVDVMPHRLYKFDGTKWFDLDKNTTNSYLDASYIKFLISKIENGEYDIDLLSENERAEIQYYLSGK